MHRELLPPGSNPLYVVYAVIQIPQTGRNPSEDNTQEGLLRPKRSLASAAVVRRAW
jgi:hypothetical protein